MSEMLTPKQAQALWTLLAAGGQGKLPPKGADPDGLIRGGYIRKGFRAGVRAALAEVNDKGWHWAETHLGDPALTPKPLQPWFAVIQGYLEREGLGLAALFVPLEPLDEAPAPPAKLPRTPKAPKPAKASKVLKPPKPPRPPTAPQLRKRIQDAYLALTGGRTNQSVPLSRLRAHLADLDRATVDGGLAAILKGDKTARLSQISDFRAISADERGAAFSPAGEPFHLIWIHA